MSNFNTYNVGKVAIRWRDEFVTGLAYKQFDSVTKNGSSYICLADNTGAALDSSYWGKLAQAGTQAPMSDSSFGELVTRVDSSLQSQSYVKDASYNEKMDTLQRVDSSVNTLAQDVSTLSATIRDYQSLENTVEQIGRDLDTLEQNDVLSGEKYTSQEKQSVHAFDTMKYDLQECMDKVDGLNQTDNNYSDTDKAIVDRVKYWNGNNITTEELRTIHDFQDLNLRYVYVR